MRLFFVVVAGCFNRCRVKEPDLIKFKNAIDFFKVLESNSTVRIHPVIRFIM